MVSNTTENTNSIQCAYIGEEGDQDVVTKECGQPLLARFLTLIRDQQGMHPYDLILCEVVAVGYLLLEGEFVKFQPNSEIIGQPTHISHNRLCSLL